MKRIKKIIAIALILVFLFPISLKAYALSNEEITAPAAVLMDEKTGRVLYEKNPREVRACASITKVMTLILIMEAIESGKISMKDSVSASAHAASMGGSDIWLEPGETMTVDEMIKAIVVASANDAAVAMAEYISGSEEEFVCQMNKKAQELQMNDTVFKNCNGLDEDGHVTSAYDVAVMSRELMKYDKIFDYTSIWIDYLRDGKTQLVNTNKLLKSYKGITGLKTGTTSQAGSCISATAKRDNLSLIAVVLGSATGKDRFKDAAKLLDYGFANFTMYKPTLPEEVFTKIPVINGMEEFVDTKSSTFGSFLIPKGREKDIANTIQLVDEVEAPVEEGQNLGKIAYSLDDQVIAEYNIEAVFPVPSMNLASIFDILLKSLVSM